MIVDTSVLIALLREEPEAERFVSIMIREPGNLKIAAANYLEAAIVTDSNGSELLSARLGELMDFFHIVVIPVSRHHADIARKAYRTYGRGHHPARLNFGDCFAYALSKASGEPLLFKGDDFAATDIVAAA
jgi:ribonuclease VapC